MHFNTTNISLRPEWIGNINWSRGCKNNSNYKNIPNTYFNKNKYYKVRPQQDSNLRPNG